MAKRISRLSMPTYQGSLSVPIPASIAHDSFVAGLHHFPVLMECHPLVYKHERIPVDIEDVTADAFFQEDGTRIERYIVMDRIDVLRLPKMPVYKDVAIDVTFQAFAGGVRSRADASGVRTYSTYSVRPASSSQTPQQQQIYASSPSSPEDYELVEDSVVFCGALVKPFVTRTFRRSHMKMLARVVESMQRPTPPLYQ